MKVRPCQRVVAILISLLSTTAVAQPAQRAEPLFVINPVGDPLPFADVLIRVGATRITASNGGIHVSGHHDSLHVRVRRIGFEPFQGKVVRAAAGTFNVTLTPGVKARKQGVRNGVGNGFIRDNPLAFTGFYDRMLEVQRGTLRGEFFTPEDLAARPVANITALLRGTRFVRVEKFAPTREAGGRTQWMMVGRNGCFMNVLVDGAALHWLAGTPARVAADSAIMGGVDEFVNGLSVASVPLRAVAAPYCGGSNEERTLPAGSAASAVPVSRLRR